MTVMHRKHQRPQSYLFLELSDQTIQRAREISQYGLKSLDALHISLAEHGMADYFVTCDDGIIKKGNAAQEKLKVKICGVLEFLSEVMYAENIEGN